MTKKRQTRSSSSAANANPARDGMRENGEPSTSGTRERHSERLLCANSRRMARVPSDGLRIPDRNSPAPDDRGTEDSMEAAPVTSTSTRTRYNSRRRRAARAAMFDACRTVPNSAPVKGESFCDCPKQGRDLKCTCGEEDSAFDWSWDTKEIHSACEVMDDRQTVIFHKNYSSGTAIARGTEPMTDRQYFWEVKMTSPVYGTDMMVGVGTANVNLGAFRHAFTSMIGRDGESWGLSYYGRTQHKGEFKDIKGAKFGQGTILGVHVDMWHGTVSYYKNRQPLGVAYTGLTGKTLYPMVASTAARTAMKVIKACSFQTSLQFLCCQVLRKLVPSDLNVISALQFPPGLRLFLENNLSWLLRPCELSHAAPGPSSSSSSSSSSSLGSTLRGFKRRKEESDSSPEPDSDTDTSDEEPLEGTSTNPPRPKRNRRRTATTPADT